MRSDNLMGGPDMAPQTPQRSAASRETRDAPLSLVLASASPRRRELLKHLAAEFAVTPSSIDERLDPGPLVDAVARLAEAKARTIAASLAAGAVLGADSIVVIDGDALGKPADAEEARTMLRRLRGRVHDVMTGVAVIDVPTGRAWTATEVTRVIMARYPDDLLERYVASGSPLDKAGGYAIQDLHGALVDALTGSYTNVIGLPLGLTARLLKAAGIPLSGSVWS